MISRDELVRIARRRGYPLQVIEKDYALTWALKAIYSNPKLAQYLVFKGGTCIGKIYAETYRLSEDLDFSTFKTGKLTNEELKQELRDAFAAAGRAGAPNFELIEKETFEKPGVISRFQVRYTGPSGQADRVKLDVWLNEHVIYESKEHLLEESGYPDAKEFTIHCYDLIEVLAEKLRAIMQRGKTRDYYDVWQIMSRRELRQKVPHEVFQLRKIVREKCSLNAIPYTPERMFDAKQLKENENEWKKSLGGVVKENELPDFNEVIDFLKQEFWGEAELAQFNEDLDVEHMHNIARQPHSELLAIRGIEIMASRLETKKIADVLRVLQTIRQVYLVAPNLRPEIKRQAMHIVERLTTDSDNEVRNTAIFVMNLLAQE